MRLGVGYVGLTVGGCRCCDCIMFLISGMAFVFDAYYVACVNSVVPFHSFLCVRIYVWWCDLNFVFW